MSYIESITTAIIAFPFIAFLFTIPFMLHNYHKYGSIHFLRVFIIYTFILYLITIYFLVILPLPTFEEALKNMSKRVNNQDLQSFCAMLVQSEKMGTSVAQSLRVYCDSLRIRKKQRIEELVQSASTKMTIPMILFLLPALFIVILYPAVIKIMENMAG